MLEVCREIGKEMLASKNPEERKNIFLLSQAIVPERNRYLDEDMQYELVLNLDHSKKEAQIELGSELDEDYRKQFFGFELMGKRSKKMFMTTNNWYYHLTSVSELIAYIEDKLDGEKEEFRSFLKDVRDEYFLQTEKGDWFLNFGRFPAKLLNNEIVEEFEEKHELKISNEDELKEKLTEKSFQKKYKDLFVELASKEVLGSGQKGAAGNIGICSVKIDDEYLHEGEFAQDYRDVVFYDRLGRFFNSSERMTKEDKSCSMCLEEKRVTGKIDIPLKFYITDKPYFFENGTKPNAYRSFSLCEDCYQEIQVGIDHVRRNYHDRLFRCEFFIVPKQIRGIENLEEKTWYIVENILERRSDSSSEEIEKPKELLEEMEEENLRFDFMFFFRDQASFNVVETIPDVSFLDLHEIHQFIEKLNDLAIYSGIPRLSLNHLYWLLFPNTNSHKNPDPEVYRKDLISLFKALIKGYPVSYRTLLNRFRDIFSRSYFRAESPEFILNNALQMNRLLTLFSKFTRMKGAKNMTTKPTVIEVSEEALSNFFDVHDDIYGDAPARRGLVMLGYLMNQIWYKQNKEGKSSTILDKLNFEGMSVRRLNRFINEITEYLKLYEVWHYPNVGEIHASMMDHLQGVSDSGLSKDEVLFCILTGFSLGRHAGIQRSKQNSEGGNDDE